jgi:hypothetical protein
MPQSQVYFARFLAPKNRKAPGGCRGLLGLSRRGFGYSFNELGSDVFLGDLRLR